MLSNCSSNVDSVVLFAMFKLSQMHNYTTNAQPINIFGWFSRVSVRFTDLLSANCNYLKAIWCRINISVNSSVDEVLPFQSVGCEFESVDFPYFFLIILSIWSIFFISFHFCFFLFRFLWLSFLFSILFIFFFVICLFFTYMNHVLLFYKLQISLY